MEMRKKTRATLTGPFGNWTRGGHIRWALIHLFLLFFLAVSLPLSASSSCISICSLSRCCTADQLLRSPGWNDINIRVRWISSIWSSGGLPRSVCITQQYLRLSSREWTSSGYLHWAAYINTNGYRSNNLSETLMNRFFSDIKASVYFIRTLISALHTLVSNSHSIPTQTLAE